MRNGSVGLLTVVVGLAANPSAFGLDVGDPAPKLSIAEWVQGEAIDLQKESQKRVHMVEFWAVWCPPCKESVPLLTKVQNKYKNELAVIGVTSPDGRGNSPTAVRKFVKDQGSKMNYHVALDDDEKTTNAYLVAARAMGIPHAFLVGKDGKIAWQGSPLDPDMESILDGLITGKYDPKLEADVNRRFQSLETALRRGQWDVVAKGLIEILKIAPANETALRVLRRVYVEEQPKLDEFRDWARGYIQANRADARAMRLFAEILLEAENITQRFPDLVLEAARAGYEGSKSRDSATIMVYAMALYQIGALDRALSVQQEAVDASQGEERQRAQALHDYYNLCKKLQSSAQ